jgi:chromosome segregation ATPase
MRRNRPLDRKCHKPVTSQPNKELIKKYETSQKEKTALLNQLKSLTTTIRDQEKYNAEQYDIYQKHTKMLEDQLNAYKDDHKDDMSSFNTLDKEMTDLLTNSNRYAERIVELEKKNDELQRELNLLRAPATESVQAVTIPQTPVTTPRKVVVKPKKKKQSVLKSKPKTPIRKPSWQ